MKRFFFSVFFLILGAALGGGGLYVGLNWKDYNPFRDKQQIAAKSLLGKFRSACATESGLRGTFIKSAEIKDGKLALLGFAASKEQIGRLQAMGQKILDENSDLKAQCEQGVSLDDFQVVSFFERLPLWQREFEEFKGAEKNTKENAIKREVMRTTRLDALHINDDGKLVVTGLSVRGDKNPDATKSVIADLLKTRIAAAGVPDTLMPEMELAVKVRPNPATTLQNKIALIPAAKDVHVVSAHYDGKGKLHLEAIVQNEGQRKFIDDALDSFMRDPATHDMVTVPGGKEAALEFVLNPVVFDGQASARAMQKKLAEYSRKENKPLLRQLRLADIVPTAVVNERKEIVTDDEGNPSYVFRVTGRLIASAAERKEIENDLEDWLFDELPRLSNANQSPIGPQLDMVERESPLANLQARAVQRGLDGVAFTEASYDGDGKLEIAGRLHEPGGDAKRALEAAVKDLLADEAPWTIAAMKPHEANRDGQSIAWKDAVRECKTKLAGDAALGRRVRLDRLYFDYVGGKLQLVSGGVFLADSAAENPSAAIVKSIDATIVSRSKVDISVAKVKSIKNPLADLQNLLTNRAELDGAVLTAVRHDVEGKLHLDGNLGQPEHKTAITTLLNEAVKKIGDPKDEQSWSLDGMKSHASTKGDWKWPDVVRACQGDMASAPESLLQRTYVERMAFRYEEPAGKPRRLTLDFKTTCLVKPKEKLDDLVLAQKLDASAKRLLPGVEIEQSIMDVREVATPIYDLQKLAADKKFDGMLFADAFYDREGKLAFDGMRGGDTKDVKVMIEQHLAKDKKMIAPLGLADLDKMKLSPWQAMLEEMRTNLSGDAQAIFKQTRIDRAYFEHDTTGGGTRIRFEGVCIYQGKTPNPEKAPEVMAEMLKKQLQAKGIAKFELAVDTIERKASPVRELQEKAEKMGMDGVVFNQIGFDAKNVCYVKLPFVPKGQEANIRKLLDEAAKAHPHLGPIQQR